jgi:alpha-D-ribose 1-methylphosphonate 5-triphosphate synthase subunit PhnH
VNPTREHSGLAAGFADPVHDAQGTFRAVLAAMSRPGAVRGLPALPGAAGPGDGLGPGLLAVLLTLADLETPVWLEPGLAGPHDADFLRFHCGCPLVGDPAEARFAVAGPGLDPDHLARLPRGEPEYPDRSATVLLAVDGLTPGRPGEGMRLTGPGIAGGARLEVAGLAPAVRDFLPGNRELFPLGLDFILVAGGQVACLPRSVRVEQA